MTSCINLLQVKSFNLQYSNDDGSMFAYNGHLSAILKYGQCLDSSRITKVRTITTTKLSLKSIMCTEWWTQYLHCNHEHVPMRHIYRCRRIDPDANPRLCPQYQRRKRPRKFPDMCIPCRRAGVTADEGYEAGRRG